VRLRVKAILMSASPKFENTPVVDIPFVNEERLNWKNWCFAVLAIFLIALLTSAIWKKIERFETGPDYRIPYSLSRDYWLYQRRLNGIDDPSRIVLLGDSVIWGEYVLPDGTLSHFLNQKSGATNRFVNGGVNGLFPLALGGLVDHYAGTLRHRKVILHCNLLWMSSPKADLSTTKEEKFNHSRLVPQFSPKIPCYRADANERLSVVIERNVSFLSWVNHLQSAYYGDKSIPVWTLQDDGEDPPRYTNTYKNPLRQITFEVPTAPANDPQRGPVSPRHKPWDANGANLAQFEWVPLENSLQWAGFQRTFEKLRARGDDVFVLLGPFNEHMIAPESQGGYRQLRDGVQSWLKSQNATYLAPEPLPSNLYADASHPLTHGYELLATQVFQSEAFQNWLSREQAIGIR
jgi:hypothetical protein